MALNKEGIKTLYHKRAKRYDLSANLYYLAGFREHTYRKKAVKALDLKPGDTVVEIGCGTGLNFSLLQKAIGPEGRIIGVDLTEEMLDRAKKRIERKGWANVELVRCDAESFQFPENLGGVFSTFAITLIPEFDRIIKNGAESLKTGKKLVVLDFKLPDNAPKLLIKLAVFLTRPFGVSLELAERHPWESVSRYLSYFTLRQLYFGFVYIAAGKKNQ
jgi:ubiquinone/menaquinone biosynthesis C-methylase UbiE